MASVFGDVGLHYCNLQVNSIHTTVTTLEGLEYIFMGYKFQMEYTDGFDGIMINNNREIVHTAKRKVTLREETDVTTVVGYTPDFPQIILPPEAKFVETEKTDGNYNEVNALFGFPDEWLVFKYASFTMKRRVFSIVMDRDNEVVSSNSDELLFDETLFEDVYSLSLSINGNSGTLTIINMSSE